MECIGYERVGSRRGRSVRSPDEGHRRDTIDGQAETVVDITVRECIWPPLRLDRLRHS